MCLFSTTCVALSDYYVSSYDIQLFIKQKCGCQNSLVVLPTCCQNLSDGSFIHKHTAEWEETMSSIKVYGKHIFIDTFILLHISIVKALMPMVILYFEQQSLNGKILTAACMVVRYILVSYWTITIMLHCLCWMSLCPWCYCILCNNYRILKRNHYCSWQSAVLRIYIDAWILLSVCILPSLLA